LIVVSCPPLSSSLIVVPRPCPRPTLLSVVVVNVRRLCPHRDVRRSRPFSCSPNS
jgi:hypothetical protein